MSAVESMCHAEQGPEADFKSAILALAQDIYGRAQRGELCGLCFVTVDDDGDASSGMSLVPGALSQALLGLSLLKLSLLKIAAEEARVPASGNTGHA